MYPARVVRLNVRLVPPPASVVQATPVRVVDSEAATVSSRRRREQDAGDQHGRRGERQPDTDPRVAEADHRGHSAHRRVHAAWPDAGWGRPCELGGVDVDLGPLSAAVADEVVAAGVRPVVEDVAVGAVAGQAPEDGVKALAGADGHDVGLVRGAEAVRPRMNVASRPTTCLDPGEGHRRLHEAEVGEAEEDPIAGLARDQRRLRLVGEVRSAGRGQQVVVCVARHDERVVMGD